MMTKDPFLNLLPTPKWWRWLDTSYTFDTTGRIHFDYRFETLVPVVRDLFEERYSKKLSAALLDTAKRPNAGIYLLYYDENVMRIAEESGLKWVKPQQEGYLLKIDENRILLCAITVRGLFYALQSLRRLMFDGPEDRTLRGLVIVDYPDFALRGVSDDISRGQVSTMENFKEIIRFLASHKMNVYMPYLEDLYRFEGFPSIGKNRGALSKEECIELQDFADRHHVQIIPIFQTLGHYENLLIQPEFQKLAEFTGAGSLDVTSEETYAFLQKVLDEIVPVFRSEYFHMGADESWDVGAYKSREVIRRYGVAEVHARHYRRVYDMLSRHGKTVMMYGDIVLDNPSILEKIPRDIILFDWHYEVRDSYPSTELLEKSGFRFIVSPGVQSWSRVFPHQTNALANTERFIRNGYENGAIGAITSTWGDFGGANLRELNYYGYATAADNAWNVRDRDVGRFEKIFFNVFFGSDDPGFAAVYHNLASCTQHFKTDYLFGHPFYTRPLDTQDIVGRAYELVSFGEQIGSHLRALRSSVSRNRDHMDILAWCADMFVWVGHLENVKLDLTELSARKRDDTVLRKKTERRIADLHWQLRSLRERYEKLWLRTNRTENLHRILSLFRRVETQLKIGERQIAAGDLSLDGRLTAPFIGFRISSRQNAGVPRIALRKRFTLAQNPGDTWLQIIADSHAIVSLNEEGVGEVLARRSLSAIVENERVKAWPVTELLRKGENTLAIEVHNYLPGGCAAANVWLEIPDQRFLITSDSTWKVSDHPPSNWLSSAFDDSGWPFAVEVDIPWVISQPNFSCGLSSRIEFFKSLDRI